MLSPTACGAGGSTVVMPSRAAVSAATKAGTLDASALSTGGVTSCLSEAEPTYIWQLL